MRQVIVEAKKIITSIELVQLSQNEVEFVYVRLLELFSYMFIFFKSIYIYRSLSHVKIVQVLESTIPSFSESDRHASGQK
jgi:hypothetical protein